MLNLIEIHNLVKSLLEKYDPSLTFTPNIVISNTMRTTAGTAHYKSNSIQLNNRLLSKNPDHLTQTVAHELAHLLSYHKYGSRGRGHGARWKRTMIQLGFNHDRTHNLDTTGLRRTHTVRGYASCVCKTYPLKTRRFNNIAAGAKYRCLKCNTHLTLDSACDE